MSATNDGTTSSILHGASVTNHGVMYSIINDQKNQLEHLKLLDAEVAPNAILNAGGRADPVRCYPGTREVIIASAERWMVSEHLTDRSIFWLTGPAGSGKSAIIQTLAENGLQRKSVMASFFFFRADATRNHIAPLVATLLYQLVNHFPDLPAILNKIISQDRLVFKKSIREQFMVLVDGPIRGIRNGTPDLPPVVLLIDGLDECESRPASGFATQIDQTTLLDVVSDLVLATGSPFIAVVSSRSEPHIQMAFNRIGSARMSTYLDSDYRAAEDIRRYVVGELSRIKETHSLHQGLVQWPSESIIDTIVEKSSGQFIYPATILRFVEFSPQSPSFSMQTVLGVRATGKNSPFAELDAVYLFILSRAEHWDVARNIIALDIMMRRSEILGSRHIISWRRKDFSGVISALGYSLDDATSFFSDLRSIVDFNTTGPIIRADLQFHHASLEDFLCNAQRAGDFYIDMATIGDGLAPALLSGIIDEDTCDFAVEVLAHVLCLNEPLKKVLLQCPALMHLGIWSESPQNVDHSKFMFISRVEGLYADQASEECVEICERWGAFFEAGTAYRRKKMSVHDRTLRWRQRRQKITMLLTGPLGMERQISGNPKSTPHYQMLGDARTSAHLRSTTAQETVIADETVPQVTLYLRKASKRKWLDIYRIRTSLNILIRLGLHYGQE